MEICTRCWENPPANNQAWCKTCRAAYMRAWRPKYSELSPEDLLKARCRAYANTYQRRGKLVPEPCCICGTMENLEKHHPDYTKPLEVIWYCRHHHVMHHGTEVAQAREALKAFARQKMLEATKNPPV